MPCAAPAYRAQGALNQPLPPPRAAPPGKAQDLSQAAGRAMGSTFQMVLAYWAIVRSDENRPMPATLSMAFRIHAAWSRYNSPTFSWQAT